MSDQERWEKEKAEQQSILKRNFSQKETKRKVDDEEAERIICAELKDDDLDEYLVDGAVLACTSATWDDFHLSDGEVIKLDGSDEKQKKGEPTEYLRVPENPMSANDLRYATVADTKREWNIMPFPCNCKEPALFRQETEIKENKVDCQSHGVCKYMMDLEEEWENYDIRETLSFSLPVPFSEPVPVSMSLSVPYEVFTNQKVDSGSGDALMSEIRNRDAAQEKKGITMTSILFCKHGGFIYPRTSGQTVLLGGFWNSYQSMNLQENSTWHCMK